MSAPLSPLHAMLATIERVTNARRLNEIANNEHVLPWVEGWSLGKLDLTELAANPDNICLVGMHGAICFTLLQPGLMEAHSMALKAGRGAWMKLFAEACEHAVFCQTPTVEIATKCPSLASKALARALGWTKEFRLDRGWVLKRDPVPADVYFLRIQDWARNAPGLSERGHWFHEKLEAEFASHGKAEPPHGDDATHDRYVGLCAEMLLSGQPDKAVIFYNRIAAMAGYQQIAVASYSPLVVEIVSAQIIVRPETQDFWCPLVR